MRITNAKWIVTFAVLLVALSACGSNPTPTPPPTRVATQTPWVIYVPITATPEPPTVTPLPTVTASKPSRTPTRTVAPKPTVVATKPPATPVVAAPSPTAAPACSAGSVTLRFPENGAPRSTKRTGPGPDIFDFKWDPFQAGETDSQIGYRIDIESKRVGTNQIVNGDAVYISHNGFLRSGQHYPYDQRAVFGLAGGDNVTVLWKVTVVKTTGSFDDQGHAAGSVINCGPPSQTWTIQLIVNE